MTRRLVLALSGAVTVVAAGWALAQPGGVFPGKLGPDGPNRFSVAPMGPSAVMVDTVNGRTWVLHPSADGRSPVLLPAARVDDAAAAGEWHQKNERMRDVLDGQKKKTK